MKTNKHFLSYFAQLFLKWEMFHIKFTEEIKTDLLFSTFFFRKSCHLWNYMEKYCRAWQDIDGNMAHAHCMLDT